MPNRAPQQTESSRRVLVRRGSRSTARRRFALIARSAAWLAAELCLGVALCAQTAPHPAVTHSVAHAASKSPAHSSLHASPHSPRHSTAHRTVHTRTHVHAKPAAAKPTAQIAPPAAPPAPPMPNWPANNKPAAATVVWDSHGLLIEAANSSLDQILNAVSLKTGIKVIGMGTDERIFGAYGPGPARDVLNQLLDGSGYNILMVGDQGGGTPRRIVLSGRPTGPAPPGNVGAAQSYNDPADNDQDSGQSPTPPNPYAQVLAGRTPPGMPPRSPQQMLEERTRQLQLMQQRQQNNSNNSQN